ncbi:MAG: sodium/solute symporter, partial [Deltaproteobacteria bacterium]|nr:sodium/solute symporter [Deltaproteobacteria bacterium]
AAFIFVPFFWKAKVFTVPEYLGRRFNETIRTTMALIWGLFMCAMLGTFLYAAAIAMENLMGLPPWLSVIITAIVVGLYTFSGGLRAVVITDAVQFVILFLGSALILVFGFNKIGGIEGLMNAVDTTAPGKEHYFHLILKGDTPHPFSWSAVLFGLAFVLSPAYWIGNQAIVQRNLGTKSQRDAKKSVLFGAFLKLFIPAIIVIPGMIGFGLYPHLEDGQEVFPHMLKVLLPPGVKGIVFAGFLAALMSSVDSYLNSASTLWTMDIYKRHIKKDATSTELFKVGKILTASFIIMAIPLAYIAAKFGNIFSYMQTLLSLFQGPTLAILVLGMLYKRTNSKGAMTGLFGGLAVSSFLFYFKDLLFIATDPFLYIAWWSFVASLILTYGVSMLTLKPSVKNTEGLCYTTLKDG